MRDDSSKDGFHSVADSFEALVTNPEDLIAVHTATGSATEIVARIERAKVLACRAANLARASLQHSSRPPKQRGSALDRTYAKNARRM